MTPHSQSATTAAPRVVHIAPGQSLWACLAPGTILHATQGEVAIRLASCIHEHAIEFPAQTVLKAGTPLPLGERHHATWALLRNPTHSPAEVRVVESPPEPGLIQKAWALVRVRIFGGRRKAHRNATHGAFHAAQ